MNPPRLETTPPLWKASLNVVEPGMQSDPRETSALCSCRERVLVAREIGGWREIGGKKKPNREQRIVGVETRSKSRSFISMPAGGLPGRGRSRGQAPESSRSFGRSPIYFGSGGRGPLGGGPGHGGNCEEPPTEGML